MPPTELLAAATACQSELATASRISNPNARQDARVAAAVRLRERVEALRLPGELIETLAVALWGACMARREHATGHESWDDAAGFMEDMLCFISVGVRRDLELVRSEAA